MSRGVPTISTVTCWAAKSRIPGRAAAWWLDLVDGTLNLCLFVLFHLTSYTKRIINGSCIAMLQKLERKNQGELRLSTAALSRHTPFIVSFFSFPH
ncbi:hypothetical protein M441DRAFT_302789 [Trichoderma asperellum CBS 433.97]|uniref:Uncharacterized protein n=1 Tax=Trichoderma asperellum (strain ATCC 204424 / CBS 433.97 / NBRC 101777) TaxID=1042311 RepID=A0A2T3ZJI5_TRIA4|nr:hypothetical protein M441DRAFT_302789 [Trichoderma asperellum CBS 433.97]PTB44974.1 hypothetical protein M441DRAFT_302789 [Trichoderma asperellum CBS 433.97]